MSYPVVPETKLKDNVIKDMTKEISVALTTNTDLESQIPKYRSVLSPLSILEIFEKIDEQSLKYLIMNKMHPKYMILDRIFVPPICIRPSVASSFRAGTTEDDITMLIADIIFLNDVINKNKKSGVNLNHLKVIVFDTCYLFSELLFS